MQFIVLLIAFLSSFDGVSHYDIESEIQYREPLRQRNNLFFIFSSRPEEEKEDARRR